MIRSGYKGSKYTDTVLFINCKRLRNKIMIKGALKRLLRYLGSFLCVSAKEFTVLRKLTHGRLKICVCVYVCVCT